MSNKIIILSKRPAFIKEILDINFEDEFSTPLKKRQSIQFKNYFNIIWGELDKVDEHE
ncbi:hypothetical protein [Clostridium grantii]|uniref:hypothetical protein n=1 Tax=Clostridium grantii TaxID=40575 RepID=UPI0013565275|nr:hypothetical protein [Clostridium grantii]